jgi:hypothetical protein
MAANKKLTPILTGRTVHSIEQAEGLLVIAFSDGSTMKIKTAGPMENLDFPDHPVRKVRQTGAVMKLDFEDDSSVEIRLAEAMSSVLLRDGQGVLEYAD